MDQQVSNSERISNRVGEGSYRRGVSQAMDLAADLVKQGRTWQDLAWLADESLKMRADHKPHPAYIDELLARLRIEKDGVIGKADVVQRKVQEC